MQKFKFYGYAGIVLMLASWAGNWFLPGFRTHLLFFPQWLGLILFVDAWVFKRKKSSLLNRSLIKFIMLFLFSVPVWWLFEFINQRNQNWLYLGRDHFTDVEFFVLASISFSTVMPAVFEMAELVSSFRWTERLKIGPRVKHSVSTALWMIVTGIAFLAADLMYPEYFYVFMWISVYLIPEGINILLKNKTLVDHTDHSNWRPLYMLALGCLACGFLWEFWNYYSYPKWIYKIPYLGFAKIFEMPVLGFLGYIPFSFELYAIYMLITGTKKSAELFVVIF
jgi:hypothetical protein